MMGKGSAVKNPPSAQCRTDRANVGTEAGRLRCAHGPLRTMRRRTSRASGPATNFRDGRSRGGAPETPDLILTSPYLRTRQTATATIERFSKRAGRGLAD